MAKLVSQSSYPSVSEGNWPGRRPFREVHMSPRWFTPDGVVPVEWREDPSLPDLTLARSHPAELLSRR
jgi:hypothetical protein